MCNVNQNSWQKGFAPKPVAIAIAAVAGFNLGLENQRPDYTAGSNIRGVAY